MSLGRGRWSIFAISEEGVLVPHRYDHTLHVPDIWLGICTHTYPILEVVRFTLNRGRI